MRVRIRVQILMYIIGQEVRGRQNIHKQNRVILDTKSRVRGTAIVLLLVRRTKTKFTFIIVPGVPVHKNGHMTRMVMKLHRQYIQYRVQIVVLPVDGLVGRSRLRRI